MQCFVALRLQFRFGQVGSHLRFDRMFVQKLRLQLHAQIRQLGFHFLRGEFCIANLPLQIGVAQLQQNRLGPHSRPGAKKYLIHMRVGFGGKPPRLFRHQRSQARNMPHQRPASHRFNLQS